MNELKVYNSINKKIIMLYTYDDNGLYADEPESKLYPYTGDIIKYFDDGETIYAIHKFLKGKKEGEQRTYVWDNSMPNPYLWVLETYKKGTRHGFCKYPDESHCFRKNNNVFGEFIKKDSVYIPSVPYTSIDNNFY